MLVSCAMALAAANVWAKRAAPSDVPSVVSGNVRYEAPHFTTTCTPNQNGGCVVAYDNTTNAQLWALQVYCTKYDPNLEEDVQDVFITSLVLDDSNQLQVTNEASKHFTIDPITQKVTGDHTGCSEKSSGGCSYVRERPDTPTLVLLGTLGLVGLLGARRLRATGRRLERASEHVRGRASQVPNQP
jgi:hypothetical protein